MEGFVDAPPTNPYVVYVLFVIAGLILLGIVCNKMEEWWPSKPFKLSPPREEQEPPYLA